MPSESLFTSESVTEGHPDKVADQISDAILDAHLSNDPNRRVACEALVCPGHVVIAGEVSPGNRIDVDPIVRDVVRQIGYTDPTAGFGADTLTVDDRLTRQSGDIARGVGHARDATDDPLSLQGAGDQGLMFGYATNETPEALPTPIAIAHRLARRLAGARRDGSIPGLQPDGKTQVTVRYRDRRPVGVEQVLVSTMHEPEVDQEQLREEIWQRVVAPVLADELDTRDVRSTLLVNPAGPFVEGGPAVDCGLTGRKIIVDTYGGFARHGGGAFSGKDPSKVDRSGAYAARWVAKHVVAAGLAKRCEVQVAYAIGVAAPVSVALDCAGSSLVDAARLERAVGQVFDLRPAAITRALELLRPIYRPTAAYGHFGVLEYPWERTDRVEELRAACGVSE